jgi:hypothetical protein
LFFLIFTCKLNNILFSRIPGSLHFILTHVVLSSKFLITSQLGLHSNSTHYTSVASIVTLTARRIHSAQLLLLKDCKGRNHICVQRLLNILQRNELTAVLSLLVPILTTISIEIEPLIAAMH